MEETWTIDQLREELKRFEEALVAAGKKINTINTYVDRAERFVRWLDGTYDPAQEMGRPFQGRRSL
jgi:hypothetical protein